jgi:indolepyruvate ferredoxin oxidoreductase, alpha subunit
MKVLGDLLLSEKPFQEIVMGNFAMVRAMVEAGTQVVTTYPGSPTPEIATAILSIPSDKRPFYFEFSVNEKVATEVAFGASINGHLSTVFFKSVGLNVASDSFMQLSLLELSGGMVIILGDDPGANSSQNEQDNRHYARMACMPVFEPSSPQTVYEMYMEAARVSKKHAMPVILRLTTHVCHAKAMVHSTGKPAPAQDRSPRFFPQGDEYIPLTSKALQMKARAREKLNMISLDAENDPSMIEENNGNGARGIITGGLPYLSLLDVLTDLSEKPDILCLGMTYPLPADRMIRFCREHDEVKVIEELDPILEQELKSMAYDAGLKTKIVGKADDDEWIGEYTPAKVRTVLSRIWPDLVPPLSEGTETSSVPPADLLLSNADNKFNLYASFGVDGNGVPNRPAQMCPGCGHRSAFHAVKKALKDISLPEGTITVADIGCHTLGYMPPYEVGRVLLSMGHSVSTGAGLSIFNDTRKVVAFIGDSTFFHAGMPGIVNAIYNNHDVTLIAMTNGTTAMTGHQENPGSGKNASGAAEKLNIKTILESMGVGYIREVDAYKQSKLSMLIREAVEYKGFSVVIASHPCMLKFTRDQRKRGFSQKTRVMVNQDTCGQIHECVSGFGCPAFQIQEDDTVKVSSDLCIGDGSCIQTCPASALEIEKI